MIPQNLHGTPIPHDLFGRNVKIAHWRNAGRAGFTCAGKACQAEPHQGTVRHVPAEMGTLAGRAVLAKSPNRPAGLARQLVIEATYPL
jgi:hypothetical protein